MQVEYKKNFQVVLKRYQALWNGEMQNKILARIQVRNGYVQRDAFMANIPDIEKMFNDYLNFWRTTAELEDDSLPVIAPSFGTGIEGGYFGAPFSFANATSWCSHITDIIDCPEKILYNPQSEAVNLVRRCLKYYIENNNNRCIAAVPNIDCPIDILYMLRGSEIYTDFNDNPHIVKKLLNTITQGILEFRKEFAEMIPLYQGGTFNSWMNWWLPGRTVMTGADLFCSCSVQTYRQFGLPVHQHLAKTCGKAWFHLHNLGIHLADAIAEIENLLCLEISEDPNVDLKGLRLLRKIKSIVPAELVIKIAVRPDEFLESLNSKTLPGNTIYDVCAENYQDIDYWDVDFANNLMRKVRDYRSK